MRLTDAHHVKDEDIEISVVAIFSPDKKVLLVRRPDDEETNPGLWECPGGHRETGETVEDAAIREVKEETGLDVHVQPGREYFSTKDGKVGVIVRGTVMITDFKLQTEEHDKFAWVSRKNLHKAKPTHPDFEESITALMKRPMHARKVESMSSKIKVRRKAAEHRESPARKRDKIMDIINETQAVFTSVEDPAWEALWKLGNLKSPDYEHFHRDHEPTPTEALMDKGCQSNYGKNEFGKEAYRTISEALALVGQEGCGCTHTEDGEAIIEIDEVKEVPVVARKLARQGLMVFRQKHPSRLRVAVPRYSYIKKTGESQWTVYSKKDKALGRHGSRHSAEQQLKAIETNKHASRKTAAFGIKGFSFSPDPGPKGEWKSNRQLVRYAPYLEVEDPHSVATFKTQQEALKVVKAIPLGTGDEEFRVMALPGGRSGTSPKMRRPKVRDPFMPDTPEQAREYLKRPGLEKIHSQAHLKQIKDLARRTSGRRAESMIELEQVDATDPAKDLQKKLGPNTKVEVDPTSKNINVTTEESAPQMMKKITEIVQKDHLNLVPGQSKTSPGMPQKPLGAPGTGLTSHRRAKARRVAATLRERLARKPWFRSACPHMSEEGISEVVIEADEEKVPTGTLFPKMMEDIPVRIIFIVVPEEGPTVLPFEPAAKLAKKERVEYSAEEIDKEQANRRQEAEAYLLDLSFEAASRGMGTAKAWQWIWPKMLNSDKGYNSDDMRRFFLQWRNRIWPRIARKA